VNVGDASGAFAARSVVRFVIADSGSVGVPHLSPSVCVESAIRTSPFAPTGTRSMLCRSRECHPWLSTVQRHLLDQSAK
jgi:hypothetical protein